MATYHSDYFIRILSSYVEKCKEKPEPDEAIHVFYTLTGQDKVLNDTRKTDLLITILGY